MNFQSIVLIIAAILLIICLVLIGVSLAKAKNNANWPPKIATCPDYWYDNGKNGSKCTNQNLGNGKIAEMNFSVSPYVGENSACAKYKWATSNGITWDGITSGVHNPCDPSFNELEDKSILSGLFN